MEKTKKFKAFIPVRSTETNEVYLDQINFYQVPMDDMKKANQVSNTYMGFKIVYGLTADGKVYQFLKAGRWAKRDFKMMKDMGVIELGCSWTFAPSNFEVDGRAVKLTKTFEVGKGTVELLDRWARALM